MRCKFTLLCTIIVCLVTATTAQKTADDLAERNPTTAPSIQEQIIPQAGNRMPPPPAPIATGDILCTPGVATLNATPSAGGTINWYNVATGGTSLSTGNNFTPTVANNTDFWAEEVVGGGSTPAQTFSTPFNANNGQRGCMFDITATNTITINQFSSSLYAGTTANYEIYYRAGTHVGFENNAAAWTLLGSTTGLTSAGNNVPTLIPITFSVTIPAGQTYSFYVTNDFGAGTSYTDGTAVGNFLASNADMTIYEGVGKSYPFGLTFNVRNFNGTVHYNAGSGPMASPRTMVTATVRTPEYAPTNMTTISNATCVVNESGVDWTYYYNTANPEELLFAIAHDPNNLGNNNFTATASITVRNSSTIDCYKRVNIGAQLARFVMGRYWNVNLNSGSITDPVWIRFYYDPAEKTAMDNKRNAWRTTNGGTNSPSYFFKTVGTTFDHTVELHYQGVYNSIPLINFIDNQTSSNGKNYVEIRDISSFSGGGLISGVVPVGGSTSANAILLETELLDFNIKKENNQSVLNWSTAQEKSLSHFKIEHSSDGITFEAVGTENSRGNTSTNTTTHYQWIHLHPNNGVNYYRLKLIDTDGAYSYSDLRTITHQPNDSPVVQVYPNPFGTKLHTRLNLPSASKTTLIATNSLGQVVYHQTFMLDRGVQELSIPNAHQWDAGCYHLTVQTADFSKHQMIIKK